MDSLPSSSKSTSTTLSLPPQLENLNPNHTLVRVCTSFPPNDLSFLIELYSPLCPLTCRNFLQLALEGYYNTTPINSISSSPHKLSKVSKISSSPFMTEERGEREEGEEEGEGDVNQDGQKVSFPNIESLKSNLAKKKTNPLYILLGDPSYTGKLIYNESIYKKESEDNKLMDIVEDSNFDHEKNNDKRKPQGEMVLETISEKNDDNGEVFHLANTMLTKKKQLSNKEAFALRKKAKEEALVAQEAAEKRKQEEELEAQRLRFQEEHQKEQKRLEKEGEESRGRGKKLSTSGSKYLKSAFNKSIVTTIDFEKDICKDFNETGFCPYGDACIYLHDRFDTKSSTDLQREWEAKHKEEKEKLEAEEFEKLQKEKEREEEERRKKEMKRLQEARRQYNIKKEKKKEKEIILQNGGFPCEILYQGNGDIQSTTAVTTTTTNTTATATMATAVTTNDIQNNVDLDFTHTGMVGMYHDPLITNSNLSQFFITLGKESRGGIGKQFLDRNHQEISNDDSKVKQENERLIELQEMNGKYTCFGKVYGHDIYNVLHLSDSIASPTSFSSSNPISRNGNVQSFDEQSNTMITIKKIEVVKWGTYFTGKNAIIPRPLTQIDHQSKYEYLRKALQTRSLNNFSINEEAFDAEIERRKNMKKAKDKANRVARRKRKISLHYDDEEEEDDDDDDDEDNHSDNDNDDDDSDNEENNHDKHLKKKRKEKKRDNKRSKSNNDKSSKSQWKDKKAGKKKTKDHEHEIEFNADSQPQNNFYDEDKNGKESEERNERKQKSINIEVEHNNSVLAETMRESQRLLRELQEGGKTDVHSKSDHASSKDHKATERQSSKKSTISKPSLLAEMRQKYVGGASSSLNPHKGGLSERSRKRLLEEREAATLARLSKFRSFLQTEKNTQGTGAKSPKYSHQSQGNHSKRQQQEEEESYRGQITEVDYTQASTNPEEREQEKKSWFLGKLKFKKHIDDEYRYSDNRGEDLREKEDDISEEDSPSTTRQQMNRRKEFPKREKKW